MITKIFNTFYKIPTLKNSSIFERIFRCCSQYFSGNTLVHRNLKARPEISRGINIRLYYQFCNGKSNSLDEKQQTLDTQTKVAVDCNFKELVLQSTAFVDKSLFIRDIWNSPERIIEIAEPVRSGKTTNLSMLKCFFEIQVDREGNKIDGDARMKQINYKLFAGGKIQTCDRSLSQLKICNQKLVLKQQKMKLNALDLQGTVPIIYLDFKNIGGNNYQEILNSYRRILIWEFNRHGYLGKQHKNDGSGLRRRQQIRQQYLEYKEMLSKGKISDNQTAEIALGLLLLSKLLYEYFNKKVWILIDQYDTPLNSIFLQVGKRQFKLNQFIDGGQFKRTRNIFRRIFESALKSTNSIVEKAILTGILDCGKSSFLGALNNAKSYNLTNHEYSEYYGFDEYQVTKLIADIKTKTGSIINHEQLRELCNLYNYGKRKNVYNTWAAIDYLNYGIKLNQWTEFSQGSTLELVKYLITSNMKVQTQLNYLVDKKENQILPEKDKKILEPFIKFKLLKNFTYEDLLNGDINAFLSSLVWMGYLTPSDDADGITIANHAVKDLIKKRLLQWFKNIASISSLLDMFTELFKENYKSFQSKLDDIMMQFSYFDFPSQQYYHNFMTLMTAWLPQNLGSVSNRECGKGRSDAILHHLYTKTGFVLEYKYEKYQIQYLKNDLAKLTEQEVKAFKREDVINNGKKITISIQRIANAANTQILERKYAHRLKDHHLLKILNVVVVWHTKNPYVFVFDGKKRIYASSQPHKEEILVREIEKKQKQKIKRARKQKQEETKNQDINK